MKLFINFYRLLNLMSIDVACGAVICSSFFAKLLNVQLFFPALISLGLTVWIIYSADHLYDAYKLKRKASTARHLFHQKYFQVIGWLVLVACIINLIMICYLRTPIFNYGVALASMVLLYLIFHQWIHPFKELIAASLYSMGVVLPGIAMGGHRISASIILLMIVFFLTALINLILFSWFDEKRDLHNQQSSLITLFGNQNGRTVLLTLFLLQGVFLTLLFCYSSYRVEAMLLVMMNLVLCSVFAFSEMFKRQDLYRLIGDIIFIFPITYLVFYAG